LLLWRRLPRLDVLRDRRHCWCTLPRALRFAIDSASCAPCAALLWYRRSANSCSSTWSESLSSRAARSWCWSEPLQLLHGRLPCRCGLLAACSSRSTPPRCAIVRSSTLRLHVMIMLASRRERDGFTSLGATKLSKYIRVSPASLSVPRPRPLAAAVTPRRNWAPPSASAPARELSLVWLVALGCLRELCLAAHLRRSSSHLVPSGPRVGLRDLRRRGWVGGLLGLRATAAPPFSKHLVFHAAVIGSCPWRSGDRFPVQRREWLNLGLCPSRPPCVPC